MVATVMSTRAVRCSLVSKTTKPARQVRAAAGKTAGSKSPGGKDYMLTLPGISAPMGFFDPLGFTDSPTFTVSEAKRYREAEVTHGRVAMLAALGWVVAEEYHPLFNGVGGYSSFARFQAVETVFSQFWEVLLIGIGICEGFRISRGYNDPKEIDQIQESYIPGDLGFDPLGLLPEDEDALYDLKTKELNNGRLAMLAIAAFVAQEDVEKNSSIWRELVERDIIPPREAALLPDFQ